MKSSLYLYFDNCIKDANFFKKKKIMTLNTDIFEYRINYLIKFALGIHKNYFSLTIYKLLKDYFGILKKT